MILCGHVHSIVTDKAWWTRGSLHVKMVIFGEIVLLTVSLSEGAGDPCTWGAASDNCGSSGPDMMID